MPDREGERFERLAEALARMWVEHPESLASPIRVLEHSRDNEPRRGGSSRVGFFHVGAGPYPALFCAREIVPYRGAGALTYTRTRERVPSR
jgi:hypothetical protein